MSLIFYGKSTHHRSFCCCHLPAVYRQIASVERKRLYGWFSLGFTLAGKAKSTLRRTFHRRCRCLLRALTSYSCPRINTEANKDQAVLVSKRVHIHHYTRRTCQHGRLKGPPPCDDTKRQVDVREKPHAVRASMVGYTGPKGFAVWRDVDILPAVLPKSRVTCLRPAPVINAQQPTAEPRTPEYCTAVALTRSQAVEHKILARTFLGTPLAN